MSKETLITHLTNQGGKLVDETWDDVAKRHGCLSGDSARSAWNRHRKKIGKIEDKQQTADYIIALEARISKFEEHKNGTAEVIIETPPGKCPKTKEDLIEFGLIDTNVWEIDRMVQNWWGSPKDPHWQVKAWLSPKKDAQIFQEAFINFLKTYEPPKYDRKKPVEILYSRSWTTLVINKQDAHLNKFDVRGSNDITKRFNSFNLALDKTIQKAKCSSNIENIHYVIGSDEFNSEWTGMTTKGTPQQNILTYEEAFKAICDHEIEVIEKLILTASQHVEVMYIPGNHDEYVGWHMVNFLEMYFRNDERININTKVDPTKTLKYGKTAMLFNHGDVMKPEKLAGIFPREFNYDLSGYEYFYIFTGDKHNVLTKDFYGFEFYQIPALSNARGKWDIKQGHDTKAYLTSFVIDSENGMNQIIKEHIK